MNDKTLAQKLAPWAAIAAIVALLLAAGGPEVRHRVLEFLLVAGVAGAVFVMMIQTIAAKWWRSEVGRHLFIFAAAIGGGCGLPALRNWLGDFPGQDWIAIVVVMAIAGSLFWRVSIMIRETMAAIARGARAPIDGHPDLVDAHPTLQSVDRAS